MPYKILFGFVTFYSILCFVFCQIPVRFRLIYILVVMEILVFEQLQEVLPTYQVLKAVHSVQLTSHLRCLDSNFLLWIPILENFLEF